MTQPPAITAVDHNIFDSTLSVDVEAAANGSDAPADAWAASEEQSTPVAIFSRPAARLDTAPEPSPAEPMTGREESALGGWENEDQDTLEDWSPSPVGARRLLKQIGLPLAWALVAFLVSSAVVAALTGSHHSPPAASATFRPVTAVTEPRSLPAVVTPLAAKAPARHPRRIRAHHRARRRDRTAARLPVRHAIPVRRAIAVHRSTELQAASSAAPMPPSPPAPSSPPTSPNPPDPAPAYTPPTPPAPSPRPSRSGEFGFEQ